MDYIELLNLKKEPFSISPDPNFFYHSKDYEECLQKLELSIRLRRGLNIILGDVGTGKTTLSRALIQVFQGYDDFRFHLILDPSFHSEFEFLLSLIKIFNIPIPQEKTFLSFKESIRTYLLKEGLEKKRIIVLIIDETQKMDYPFIELLRDFLNFETNEYKLLQLVLFGQMEFLDNIQGKKNFMDRVNLLYYLKPLNLEDTQKMIEFRLKKAGFFSQNPLFTKDAYKKIRYYSKGYPRKIVSICHHSLLLMLIKRKRLIDRELIKAAANTLAPEKILNSFPRSVTRRKMAIGTALAVGIFFLGALGIFYHFEMSNQSKIIFPGKTEAIINQEAVKQSKAPVSANTKALGIPSLIGSIKSNQKGLTIPVNLKNTDNVPQDIPNTVSMVKKIPISQKKTEDLSPVQITANDFTQKVNRKIQKIPIKKKELNLPLTNTRINQNPKNEPYSVVSTGPKSISGYHPIKAQKGDTVYDMAVRFYDFKVNDEILTSIQRSNPNIKNLNLIGPGQTIFFPIFPSTPADGEDFHIYGLHLGYFSNIKKAQDCINRLSEIDNHFYIEKEKFPDLGTKFSVVIGPFAKINKAWDLLEKLKAKNYKNSRVIVIN